METNDIADNNILLPDGNEHSEIQLSDVIDVLDMLQNNAGIGGAMGGAGVQAIDPAQQSTAGYNGNGIIHQQQQPQQQQQQQQQSAQQQQQQTNAKNIRRKAYVKITEQPAWKALRFRYECEGRSAGSIPGINSTPENKTFPTIEIVGYKGRAVVVVSCVTKDPPYRPHPHNLVGKEGCKKGVCTLEINSETMRAVFSNLGIQCVKKKDIESALHAREDIRVDPFKTGFSHKHQPSSIDLNSVRLCFQVFLESDVKGRFTVPLPPVVSEPIFDKKAMSDLVICRLCSCSSTVEGGKEIILLCEKVAKEDISVRFYEEQNGHLVWEGFGDFQHTDVHKQTAITFKTPRYRTMQINEPAKVFIQLRRPSDGAVSEPLPFDFLPLESDPAEIKRKRQKTGGEAMHYIKRAAETQQLLAQQPNEQNDGRTQHMQYLNVMPNPAIKTEPRDTSPLPYMYNNAYRMPDQTPSPQPVSPPNPYNHNTSGTPSPYQMGAGGGMMSPNHPYVMAPTGGADTSPLPYMYNNAYRMPDQTPSPQPVSPPNPYNHNTSGTPSPYQMGAGGGMMSPNHPYVMAPTGGAGMVNGSPIEYEVYHQQQQQQQQHHHQQHAGAINQYNHMHSPSSQPTQSWAGTATHFKQPMPNINNLSNFNVNNLLTKTAVPSVAAASALNNNNNGQPWNHLSSAPMANNNFNINHMMANTQHNQHQQQQPSLQNHNDVAVQGGVAAAVAVATSASANNEAPSISSLLNIDSEQLMQFNSAELSNLSIS